MTAIVQSRETEPEIRHTLSRFNGWLVDELRSAREALGANAGYYRNVRTIGLSVARFEAYPGGKTLFDVSGIPDSDAMLYRMVAYDRNDGRLGLDADSRRTSLWSLVLPVNLIARLVLEPVDYIPVAKVLQNRHWGWLNRADVRFGRASIRGGRPVQEIGIRPTAVLRNRRDADHPFFAQFVRAGQENYGYWTVNPGTVTTTPRPPSVLPMIVAAVDFGDINQMPGSAGD